MITASITYRREDRSNPWLPILGGYRGEVIHGLPHGKAIYTGVCKTKRDCIEELISQLKAHGMSGVLRLV